MTGTVLEKILEVFLGVADWFAGAITSIIPIFYAEGSLTFVGVLGVAGLAISITMLLLNMVRSFLNFQ